MCVCVYTQIYNFIDCQELNFIIFQVYLLEENISTLINLALDSLALNSSIQPTRFQAVIGSQLLPNGG